VEGDLPVPGALALPNPDRERLQVDVGSIEVADLADPKARVHPQSDDGGITEAASGDAARGAVKSSLQDRVPFALGQVDGQLPGLPPPPRPAVFGCFGQPGGGRRGIHRGKE
jgi:hypothetical protein